MIAPSVSVRQRAFRDFRQQFVRQGLGVGIALALLGPLLYWVAEGTRQAKAQVGLWVVSGAGPLVVVMVVLLLWCLLRAPLQLAVENLAEANARIATLVGELATATAKASSFDDRLAVARARLGAELRETRHRIEIVRSTRPHPHYSHQFALPTLQWQEHGDVVAGSLELYRAVEPAYAAVAHVEAVLDMRRTRAGNGTLGVIGEDRLDELYDAAGAALDALGEERGDVWQSGIDRAVAGVVEGLLIEAPSDLAVKLAARYAQALLSAYRDIVRQGVELQRELAALRPDDPVAPELQERIGRWASRCLAWAFDSNGPLSGEQQQAFRGDPHGLLPLDLLDDIVSANLAAMGAVRDLIEV